MAGPSVIPMQVLTQLMDNGLFDTLRKSITAELENNMELKRFTTEAVERSTVLQAPGAERKSRRELFEALRRELQTKVLERASEAAWRAILSKQGVGLQIEEQVERTWWELNGWGEPPERARPAEKKPEPATAVALESQKQASTPSSAPVLATEQEPEPLHSKPDIQVSLDETAQMVAAGPDKQTADVMYTPLVPAFNDGEQAHALGTREDGGQAAEGVHVQMDASVAEPSEQAAAEAVSPLYHDAPERPPEAVPISSRDREYIEHMPEGHGPSPVEPVKSERPLEAAGKEAPNQQDTVVENKTKTSELPGPGSMQGEAPSAGRLEAALCDVEGQEAADVHEQSAEGALTSGKAEDEGIVEDRAAAKESARFASAEEGLPAVDVRPGGPDEMDAKTVEEGPLDTSAGLRERLEGPTRADETLQDELGVSEEAERSRDEERNVEEGLTLDEGKGKDDEHLRRTGALAMAVSNEVEGPGNARTGPFVLTSAHPGVEVAETAEGGPTSGNRGSEDPGRRGESL